MNLLQEIMANQLKSDEYASAARKLCDKYCKENRKYKPGDATIEHDGYRWEIKTADFRTSPVGIRYYIERLKKDGTFAKARNTHNIGRWVTEKDLDNENNN